LNSEKWVAANNLKINRSKFLEIIFTEIRRRRTVCLPPPLTDIQRVTSMKIGLLPAVCRVSQ